MIADFFDSEHMNHSFHIIRSRSCRKAKEHDDVVLRWSSVF
jgi:hypothetical protein